MNDLKKVIILLSTHNGEKYLSELLRSLQRQSFQNWILAVRDDGSQDSTLKILKTTAQTDPRIIIHEAIPMNIGIVKSYALLLNSSAQQADYVFFCDQDDIWNEKKIETFVEKFSELEKLHPQQPILLHSDLELIDENKNRLLTSFREAAKLPTSLKSSWSILARNYATGCAMAMNKKLAALACPMSRESLMHDWWLTALASFVGKIEFINQPLTQYRQHSANASGAMSEFGIKNKLKHRLFNSNYFRKLMIGRFKQSLALETHLRAMNFEEHFKNLHSYHTSIASGRISALIVSYKRGINLYSPLRTFFYFYLLFVYQPRIAKLIRLHNSLQRLCQ